MAFSLVESFMEHLRSLVLGPIMELHMGSVLDMGPILGMGSVMGLGWSSMGSWLVSKLLSWLESRSRP